MQIVSPLIQAIDAGRLIELSSGNKEEALRALAATLEQADPLISPQEVLTHVLRRESQAITYLQYGIACPHARFAQTGAMSCAIGWSPDGIEYGNNDGWPVHLVLMYYVPDSERSRYLSELSLLARVIKNDETIHELVNFKDLDEVKERLGAWVATMEGRESEKHLKVMRQSLTTVLSDLLLPDIVEMLESARYNDIRIFLAAQPAPEVAELIAALRTSDQLLIFRLLPRNLAEEVFTLLDYTSQNVLLNNMAQDDTRRMLTALSPDDRTALFEELPANVLQRLLDLLTPDDRKEALSLLSYPKDSVGRLMTNEYVAVNKKWTVTQALDHLRSAGSDSETMAVIYVLDDAGRLVGDLLLRKLIIGGADARVDDLTDRQFVALNSLQDREEAVKVFKKYDVYALPVLDANDVLIGIVTTDDIIDVSEEEATEDFHKTAAVRPLNAGYLKTPLHLLFRSRILWLVVLVFVNIFSGAGIAHFDELIKSAVVLVFFLPLLIDSGGNAGSQSATLVIRSMALGEISMRDFLRVFGREILISLSLGLAMALAVFGLAWWRGGAIIAIVVSLAMAAVVMMGSLIGIALPFIFKKLKIDPAVASSPLVTSLADVLGVLIYLAIAATIL